MFCIKRGKANEEPKIIYEIDGDKNLFETHVSRKNEEDFFKFAHDFEEITSPKKEIKRAKSKIWRDTTSRNRKMSIRDKEGVALNNRISVLQVDLDSTIQT